MRSLWNMWEPTWVSRSRCWLLTGECLGHVCMSPEPVGSTHLRFGDARVIEILVCGNPKVVWSPGCDPRHHEEFRNGPEVKIYIWEVLFWSPDKFRGHRYCTGTTGRVPGVHRVGPPAPGGHMGCRGVRLGLYGPRAPAPRGPCAKR